MGPHGKFRGKWVNKCLRTFPTGDPKKFEMKNFGDRQRQIEEEVKKTT